MKMIMRIWRGRCGCWSKGHNMSDSYIEDGFKGHASDVGDNVSWTSVSWLEGFRESWSKDYY